MKEFSHEYLENIEERIEEFKCDIKKAREIQTFIASKIKEEKLMDFQTVAALDCSYFSNKIVTAIVIYDVINHKVIEEKVKITTVNFPYIPTLLFLREGPYMVKLIKETKYHADVYLIDGNGKLHPYKAGLACYVGYLIEKPTIGVAKKKLIGNIKWISENLGNVIYENEVLGKVIRICNKDYYISVGNLIDLDSCIKVFFKCIRNCYPFPLLKAHELATKTAKNLSRKLLNDSSFDSFH
ncbi:MAG: endonuclease V [Thermoproteota archaeon]|jgi:deoxyribonuclease V|nr:endonuclease V [Thermoproteota archaeon]